MAHAVNEERCTAAMRENIKLKALQRGYGESSGANLSNKKKKTFLFSHSETSVRIDATLTEENDTQSRI